MNIFYLNPNPDTCAVEHNDKHVVKMNCEYAQLLSTAHRVIDGEEWIGRSTTGRKIKRYILEDPHMHNTLYKACHINHPSAIWVRQSKANYDWLYKMWISLGREYTYRYGKTHKSIADLSAVLASAPENIDTRPAFTEPTPAMSAYPQCIVDGNSIASYRNYYWEAKRDFCIWTKRDKPEWWNEYERKRIETETYVGISERV